MDIHKITITEYEPKESLSGGDIVGSIEQKNMFSVRVCCSWEDAEKYADKLLTAYLRSNPGRMAKWSFHSVNV